MSPVGLRNNTIIAATTTRPVIGHIAAVPVSHPVVFASNIELTCGATNWAANITPSASANIAPIIAFAS